MNVFSLDLNDYNHSSVGEGDFGGYDVEVNFQGLSLNS